MQKYLSLFLVIVPLTAYQQLPFKQIIETDSSTIEIIRNSVYRVYEEKFKNKDSVWRSVSYIDDTTQLNTEGWTNKAGKQLGVWKEYTRDGEWMYTRDHDKWKCKVNRNLYPYHNMLEKMKAKADKLILQLYGRQFVKKHTRFDFECYAYRGYWRELLSDTTWWEDFVGSWTEPLSEKPNSYLFRYEVRLNKEDEKYIELGICFDSLGRYVASSDDRTNNYGFEKIEPQWKEFTISREKAIAFAREKGLQISDSTEVETGLRWENFKQRKLYNGRFVYYVIELRKKETYERSPDRKGTVYRYHVYSFNPWTGAFIEMKKMRSVTESGRLSGFSTGLIDDK